MPSEQLVYPYYTGTNIPGSGFNTTCTVTNGSVTVTGQFTIWQTAIDKGDVLFVGGNMGLVLNRVSDTELTLAAPWAGESADATAYAVYRNNSYVDPRNYGRRLAEYLTKLRGIPDDIDAFLAQLEAIMAEIDADTQQVAVDKTAAETAATTATGAATTATGAASTATGAATTATGALADFRDIYYGPLAADPATRPDGTPSQEGDFYDNTASGLRIYHNGQWGAAVLDANGALLAANNLSDLADKAVARANLGLGGIQADSSGRLLVPSQPAFFANLSADVTRGNGAFLVSCNNISLNRGNYYNGARFTAPVAGAYLFTGNVESAGGTANAGTVDSMFYKNGSQVLMVRAEHGIVYGMTPISIVIQLQPGDYVELWGALTGTSGAIVFQAVRTYFGGHLIG
jgi:hypothetical protein